MSDAPLLSPSLSVENDALTRLSTSSNRSRFHEEHFRVLEDAAIAFRSVNLVTVSIVPLAALVLHVLLLFHVAHVVPVVPVLLALKLPSLARSPWQGSIARERRLESSVWGDQGF